VTASASSTAAANGPHLQNAETTSTERAAGENGLFRYAPEAILPRNPCLINNLDGSLFLRLSGLLSCRP
jgi:hypothetical protein